jgi:hypothetical protein
MNLAIDLWTDETRLRRPPLYIAGLNTIALRLPSRHLWWWPHSFAMARQGHSACTSLRMNRLSPILFSAPLNTTVKRATTFNGKLYLKTVRTSVFNMPTETVSKVFDSSSHYNPHSSSFKLRRFAFHRIHSPSRSRYQIPVSSHVIIYSVLNGRKILSFIVYSFPKHIRGGPC